VEQRKLVRKGIGDPPGEVGGYQFQRRVKDQREIHLNCSTRDWVVTYPDELAIRAAEIAQECGLELVELF
jgi:hypothetical protein